MNDICTFRFFLFKLLPQTISWDHICWCFCVDLLSQANILCRILQTPVMVWDVLKYFGLVKLIFYYNCWSCHIIAENIVICPGNLVCLRGPKCRSFGGKHGFNVKQTKWCHDLLWQAISVQTSSKFINDTLTETWRKACVNRQSDWQR